MLEKLRNRKKDNKGFSLVELIIVVAILAILTGILAPQYIKWVEKSRVSKDEANADELLNAVQVALSDETYKIGENSTVTLSAAGVTVSGDALETALNDIYGAGELSKTKLTSDKYSAQSYVITVQKGTDGERTATGEWK